MESPAALDRFDLGALVDVRAIASASGSTC
jgi:hypothetical protein